MRRTLKAKSWPCCQWKGTRRNRSKFTGRSCGDLCSLVAECSVNSVTSKVLTPFDELRGQVAELLRRLKNDVSICCVVEEAIERYPFLDMVSSCDAMVVTDGSSYATVVTDVGSD